MGIARILFLERIFQVIRCICNIFFIICENSSWDLFHLDLDFFFLFCFCNCRSRSSSFTSFLIVKETSVLIMCSVDLLRWEHCAVMRLSLPGGMFFQLFYSHVTKEEGVLFLKSMLKYTFYWTWPLICLCCGHFSLTYCFSIGPQLVIIKEGSHLISSE